MRHLVKQYVGFLGDEILPKFVLMDFFDSRIVE